jgi:hypothetical protein
MVTVREVPAERVRQEPAGAETFTDGPLLRAAVTIERVAAWRSSDMSPIRAPLLLLDVDGCQTPWVPTAPTAADAASPPAIETWPPPCIVATPRPHIVARTARRA